MRPIIQPEPINSALKRLEAKLARSSSPENMLVYFHANRLSTVFAKSTRYNNLIKSSTTPIIGIYDCNARWEDIVSDVKSYYEEFRKQIKTEVENRVVIPVFRSSGRKVKQHANL